MPNFAANLSMLYTEKPFLQRFEAAAKDGFRAVEYLFPYEWPAKELAKHLNENGLQQVLFNLPPGDWSAGERGIACLPERQTEFQQGVDLAINYAQILKVSQLNCLSGIQATDHDYSSQWSTLVANVKYAAQQLARHQMTLLVEAINSRIDMPGFFIDTIEKAEKLLTEVDEVNVKIQFDIYHMQIMHGDIIRNIQDLNAKIGHIQFADNPGRHEPGTGELNFEVIFAFLDKIDFKGYVSAEYIPKTSTKQSLDWLKSHTV